MAAPGVVLYKTFTWRGAIEEWGNTYHFVGSSPTDPAGWRALVDALVTQEKAVLANSVTIDRAICYDNTDHSSVYSYNLAAFAGVVPGTYDPAAHSSYVQEGGSSYMARWDTGRRSSKGKPIFLRKYWHPAIYSLGAPDAVSASMLALVSTFAGAIISSAGAWPGLAGPDGVAPVGHLANTYTNYRDLRKGRRRPT